MRVYIASFRNIAFDYILKNCTNYDANIIENDLVKVWNRRNLASVLMLLLSVTDQSFLMKLISNSVSVNLHHASRV